MATRNKISHDQIQRATRAKATLLAGRVVLNAYDGEDESPIREWVWDDTRENGKASALFCEDVIAYVQEHAEAQGNGAHKYSLRTEDATGVERASTWFRWVVRESRDGTNPMDELDGSVGAFMAHLQRAFEEERKSRHDALRMVESSQAGLIKLLSAMADRQTTLEVEHRATREEERKQLTEALALLEAAAAKEREGAESGQGGGDFGAMMQTVGATLAEKALERFAPQLEPLVNQIVKSMMQGDGEVAEVVVDATVAPRLDS